MTPTEFKAWFDGFVEGIEGVPTLKQWERVKARAAEIDGRPVTKTVFVDRYWPTYYPRWYEHARFAQCVGGGSQQFQNYAQQGNEQVGQFQSAGNNAARFAGINQFNNVANQMSPNDAARYHEAVSNLEAESFSSEDAMRQLGRKDRDDLN